MVTFEELIMVCTLYDCKVYAHGNEIILQFPNVTIQFNKDFEVGKAEATLLTVKGWLKYFREFLDNEKKESKK